MNALKIFFVLCLFHLWGILLNAQTPAWQSAQSISGTDEEAGTGMAIDGDGNKYVVGTFTSSSLTIGTTTLTNAGSGTPDIFITKYGSAGNIVWATSIKGSDGEYEARVAVDGAGHIYVSGYTLSSSLLVGGTTISNSNSNVFTAKYDTAGLFVWARIAVGSASGGNQCGGIATDDSGNVIVHGYFNNDSVAFDTRTIYKTGSTDVFTVKYAANGDVRWVKSAGGTGSDIATGVATDNTGSVYVTGSYLSSTFTAGGTTLTNAGSRDIYIIKYNGNGSLVWAKSAGGTSIDNVYAIHVDNSNNVYVGGTFNSSSLTVDTVTVTNDNFNQDILVFKLNSSGSALWGRAAGGNDDDRCRSITTSAEGDVYVTGYFSSSTIAFGAATLDKGTLSNDHDTYVLKYNSAGSESWIISGRSALDDEGAVIAIDNSGDVYVLGDFRFSPMSFDTVSVSGSGSGDVYLAKLNETHGQLSLSLSQYQNNGTTLVLNINAYSSRAYDQVGDLDLSFSFSNTTDLAFTSGGQTAFQGSFAGSAYSGSITELGGVVTISLNCTDPAAAVTLSNNSGSPTLIARVQLNISNSAGTSSFSWVSTTMKNETSAQTYSVTGSDLNNTPLPVRLISFVVIPAGNDAKATWSTASEIVNSGFFLDRSTDAKTWQVIGFIPSKAPGGNSQSILTYEYTDHNILTSGIGNTGYYYRLRQQDLNGKIEPVGKLQYVRFNNLASAEANIKAYPNPANDVVNFRGKSGIVYELHLQDLSGHDIKNQYFTGDAQFCVTDLVPGIYICKIYSNESGMQSIRLVITR